MEAEGQPEMMGWATGDARAADVARAWCWGAVGPVSYIGGVNSVSAVVAPR